MRLRMSVVVAAISTLVVLVAAQGKPGTIEGTVTDTTGAPVPGVTVTLAITPPRTAITDERGRFAFRNVPAGVYELTTALTGFMSTKTVAMVNGGETTRLSLQMPVGSVAETVTVAGTAPSVMTQSSLRAFAFDVGLSPAPRFNTESYDHIDENGVRRVADHPLSTFSIDVDTASYANVRRFLSDGQLPPAGAVRIEELINYFHFDYPQPTGNVPFSVTTELAECPWNPAHRLALIGIHGREIDDKDAAPRNLVFLIDVSGSMMSADKLPLVRTAMRMLVDVLTPRDRVALVVYAGASGLVLPSTPGDQKDTIHRAIERLEAGGSTNGADGITLAYRVARQHFMRDGVNRVVLATDGDFNVGVTSQDELVRLIERERASGIFLSVLGVGTGNLKDSTLEQLADKGNGNYAYLDSLHEARKVLVREAGATLTTIARDVKIQVEFNPKAAKAYRLIGYENRLLNKEDFNDDKKDAGEIGAGHSVTALYEIVPPGAPVDGASVDKLKYQRPSETTRAADAAELATVKIRYKVGHEQASRLITQVLRNEPTTMTVNLGFASSVAEFGMLLRNSEHRGHASFATAIARARTFRGADADGYRAEFIRLADLAAGLQFRQTGTGRNVRD